ncbi:MAG: membrane protein insertase YidC [Pseudomonadota bacterium]
MDNRNYFLAAILSIAVLLIWTLLMPPPEPVQPAQQQTIQGQALPDGTVPSAPGTVSPFEQFGLAGQGVALDRQTALQAVKRVTFDNAHMDGSISLVGGLVDDVRLKDHTVTLGGTEEVKVLNPRKGPKAFYATVGWVDPTGQVKTPDLNTQWSLAEGSQSLSKDTPVTLEWDNGEGVIFRRTISIDDWYVFNIEQSVENRTGGTIALTPYGFVQRKGLPEGRSIYILHEGFIGVFDDEKTEKKYRKIAKADEPFRSPGTSGWIGITDKYWMAAFVPEQGKGFIGEYVYGQQQDLYRSSFQAQSATLIQDGATALATNQLFAGAKKFDVVNMYKQEEGFPRFDLAIDWGMFFFLTRPLFRALEFFGQLIGNFGVSILIVTVIVKLIFFPLANQSYAAMSKMKKLQPRMIEIRDRYKEDKPKMQQEMMALYKKEQVNPAAGCLPILVQIPVFFALYKVLYVTLEMRHAPFFGWIQDLSAPDPTSIFNLFGLLPYEPTAIPVIGQFLGIGIWPLIMGITMWVQMKMNPPPTDPIQERIFNLMPILFTFLLATFPAGLVIYWTWNNFLSLVQQYVIMKRMGVEVTLIENMKLDKLVGGLKSAGASSGAKFSGKDAPAKSDSQKEGRTGGDA